MKISGDTSGPWFPDVAADDYGNVHVVWNGPFADNPPADSLVKTALAPAGARPGAALVRPGREVGALYYTRWDGRAWTEPADVALIWVGHALRSSIAAQPEASCT